MKQPLTNFNPLINTLYFKKAGILFCVAILISFSASYATNQQVFYKLAKDSIGIDSIQKTRAALLAADGSKMFSALLASPFNNQGLGSP